MVFFTTDFDCGKLYTQLYVAKRGIMCPEKRADCLHYDKIAPMTTTDQTSELLRGLEYRDKAAVMRKLDQFIHDGLNKLQVVSDFDLTATEGREVNKNIGSWDIVDQLRPPEGVERRGEIYQSLRPLEKAGLLTDEVAHAKWSEVLDLIASYHIRVDDLRDAFLVAAQLRTGFKELFDCAKERGVPTTILSSGIKNIIDLALDHYGVSPTHVVANALAVDPVTKRLVQGGDGRFDDLIHVLNKHERGHVALKTLREQRPNGFLLGEVPADTEMLLGDNVLRICVLEPRAGEVRERDAASKCFNDGYDLAVMRDLTPVVRLFEHVAVK